VKNRRKKWTEREEGRKEGKRTNDNWQQSPSSQPTKWIDSIKHNGETV
jgi:hypothetical protein